MVSVYISKFKNLKTQTFNFLSNNRETSKQF